MQLLVKPPVAAMAGQKPVAAIKQAAFLLSAKEKSASVSVSAAQASMSHEQSKASVESLGIVSQPAQSLKVRIHIRYCASFFCLGAVM